jgi:hypothetical protein
MIWLLAGVAELVVLCGRSVAARTYSRAVRAGEK